MYRVSKPVSRGREQVVPKTIKSSWILPLLEHYHFDLTYSLAYSPLIIPKLVDQLPRGSVFVDANLLNRPARRRTSSSATTTNMSHSTIRCERHVTFHEGCEHITEKVICKQEQQTICSETCKWKDQNVYAIKQEKCSECIEPRWWERDTSEIRRSVGTYTLAYFNRLSRLSPEEQNYEQMSQWIRPTVPQVEDLARQWRKHFIAQNFDLMARLINDNQGIVNLGALQRVLTPITHNQAKILLDFFVRSGKKSDPCPILRLSNYDPMFAIGQRMADGLRGRQRHFPSL